MWDQFCYECAECGRVIEELFEEERLGITPAPPAYLNTALREWKIFEVSGWCLCVSFVQKEKTVIPAAHALFPLDLVVVPVKMFCPESPRFFFPFQWWRKPERIKILECAVLGLPASDPMVAQTAEIVQVDDAQGMVPGFHFVSAENAFNGDAQKVTPFSEVDVGEELVFKLQIF